MHYPQLPDPNGWDVEFSHGPVLADDWMCTQTGGVSDVHFWFSSRGDQEFDIEQIRNIHVSIHSDIPAGQSPLGYSIPGDVLWERDFGPGSSKVRPFGEGDQGWMDPSLGIVEPQDHRHFWQANIVGISEPFVQEEGKIYWLDLAVQAVDVYLGWKTSGSPHFNDDAAWSVPGLGWQELKDPATGASLDLAFVITTIPEPPTVMLLVLGCVGVLAISRQDRN